MLLGGEAAVHISDMYRDPKGMLHLSAKRPSHLLRRAPRGGARRRLKRAEDMRKVLAAQVQIAAELGECRASDRTGYLRRLP